MFENAHSQYSLKKALKHELDKIGIARKGWRMEDEKSHHERNESFEAANILGEAITRSNELKAEHEKTIRG